MMKKAEISVSMIVGAIIAIVTLIILLVISVQINQSQDNDREVCRVSALTRGTIGGEGIGSQLADLAPLKCSRKKICVTTNKKGNCGSSLGKEFITYRIEEKSATKAEEKIQKFLAREMAECWEMLGRGDYAIFSRDLTVLDNLGAKVIICTQIKFDETITGDGPNQLGLKEIKGLNEYLLRHKVPNHNKSYWDFLTNAYDGDTMRILVDRSSTNRNSFLDEKTNLVDTKIIAFMEIRPSLVGTILGGGAGLVGGLVATRFTGAIAGTAISSGLTVAGSKLGDEIQKWILKKGGLFEDGTSAAGIFLTDYTLEGIRELSEGSRNYDFIIEN